MLQMPPFQLFRRIFFYYSRFVLLPESLLLGKKWAFKHQDLQMFSFKLSKYK